MSTLKVDTIDTSNSSGNITVSRPLSGSGASLTALNATNLATGTVATARLGSGTANNTVFLRGDGTWATAGSTSASDLTSGTLPIARIADDAITTAKIAPDAITAAEIADNAVTDAQINTNAVTTAKINGDAITGAKIADNAIGSEHLEDDTVGIAELSASGTASSSTFLRGDNSWAAPGGGAFKQIVEVSATTWGATTSSSYVDIAGIGASITTTGGNSTVMVQIYTGGQVSHPGIRGFAAIQNYTASSSTQFEESAIVIGDNDSGSPAQKSFSNGCITHTFTGLAAQTWNFRGRWRMHAPNGSFNNSRAQGTIILWELA